MSSLLKGAVMNNEDMNNLAARTNALRRRFMEGGIAGFGSGEAVELLLSYSRFNPAAGTAPQLKLKKPALRAVFDAPDDVIIDDANGSGALIVKVVKALAARYLKERLIGADVRARPQLLSDYLMLTLCGERVEKFAAVFLDASGAVMDVETLHEGTINSTAVYPRVCIEAALRRKAAALIFVHNHPSGEASPSAQDRILMGYLDRAADAVGLAVYDHLIVGRTKVFSLRREGGWQMERPSEAAKIPARPSSDKRGRRS